MYYNPQLGGNVTNLCGYGNHAACTVEECECTCHGGPKEEVEKTNTRFRDSVRESQTSYD